MRYSTEPKDIYIFRYKDMDFCLLLKTWAHI